MSKDLASSLAYVGEKHRPASGVTLANDALEIQNEKKQTKLFHRYFRLPLSFPSGRGQLGEETLLLCLHPRGVDAICRPALRVVEM